MTHIAEMNVGYLLYPFGDPRLADFENNLERVHALAERSPGFVWRLKGADEALPENDAGRIFGRPGAVLPQLSVWESYEDLAHFVHKTVHIQFLKRRAEWAERLDVASYVLWPVDEGHIPSLTEGNERLMQLRADGPSEAAYDFHYKA